MLCVMIVPKLQVFFPPFSLCFLCLWARWSSLHPTQLLLMNASASAPAPHHLISSAALLKPQFSSPSLPDHWVCFCGIMLRLSSVLCFLVSCVLTYWFLLCSRLILFPSACLPAAHLQPGRLLLQTHHPASPRLLACHSSSSLNLYLLCFSSFNNKSNSTCPFESVFCSWLH